jgi:hypothetical protein
MMQSAVMIRKIARRAVIVPPVWSWLPSPGQMPGEGSLEVPRSMFKD